MLLLAVFGLPVMLSSVALGQGTDAGLPACCRRAGKHQCGMSMGERKELAGAVSKGHSWQAPIERCPYCPASVVAPHFNPFSAPPGLRAMTIAFQSQPAVVAQTESRWRIARERSRQKRGPPHILVSS